MATTPTSNSPKPLAWREGNHDNLVQINTAYQRAYVELLLGPAVVKTLHGALRSPEANFKCYHGLIPQLASIATAVHQFVSSPHSKFSVEDPLANKLYLNSYVPKNAQQPPYFGFSLGNRLQRLQAPEQPLNPFDLSEMNEDGRGLQLPLWSRAPYDAEQAAAFAKSVDFTTPTHSERRLISPHEWLTATRQWLTNARHRVYRAGSPILDRFGLPLSFAKNRVLGPSNLLDADGNRIRHAPGDLGHSGDPVLVDIHHRCFGAADPAAIWPHATPQDVVLRFKSGVPLRANPFLLSRADG